MNYNIFLIPKSDIVNNPIAFSRLDDLFTNIPCFFVSIKDFSNKNKNYEKQYKISDINELFDQEKIMNIFFKITNIVIIFLI